MSGTLRSVLVLCLGAVMSVGASAAFAAGTAPAALSSGSKANGQLLREFYAAFLKGDIEAAAGWVSPDFIMHVPGNGLNAGEHRGPDGFRRALSNVFAYNGGTLDVRVLVLSVNGDDAFTRELHRLNRKHEPEREWNLGVSTHYKFKAGNVSEMWVLPEDQRLYDEYWVPPTPEKSAPAAAIEPGVAPWPDVIDTEGATSLENLRLVGSMYDRFSRGDSEVVRQMISDDLVVNIVGQSPISGEYQGWDGFIQFRSRLMSMVGGRYTLEVESIAASDWDAWVGEYIRMDCPGGSTCDTLHVVMHFGIENAKITGIDGFPVDAYAWEHVLRTPR